MVVDDDESTREVICHFLASIGHQAADCAHPGDAVARILDFGADLVVLDYSMPEKNGAQVLAELRALPETKALPVVFVSGTDATRFAGTVPSETLIRFLSKPLELERLQGMIRDLLSGGDGHAPAP